MTADAVGGVWTYSLELVRSLAEYDVEFLLVTMGKPPTEDQRREAKALENLTLVESDYRLEWMSDPWNDLAAASRWLMQLERGFEPDVVHLNSFAFGSLPWRAPVLIVAHSCVLSWHQAVRSKAAGAQWSRYQQAVSAGLVGADLIVAPTRSMLTMLGKHYVTGENQQVIFNGREVNGHEDHANQRPAKQPLILSVGRAWDEAKNIAAVVEAAAHVKWPVRVVSMRHPDGEVVKLGKNVELLDQQPAAEMHRQYAQASVLAHPARYEPFGLVPLEAALAGCALVLGDIPSLREVWGDAAIFVSPDDPAALAARINELIDDSERRQRFADAAHRRAQQYSLQRMAQQYLVAYRSLLLHGHKVHHPSSADDCASSRVSSHRR